MRDKWKDTRYKNLLTEIDNRHPRFILEFGTWKARTAVVMMQRAMQYRNDVLYFGIDLFECLTAEQKEYEHSTKDYCTKKSSEEYIKKFGISHERFLLFMGESRVMFPKIRERFMKDVLKSKYFDFIFIDGGHSLETITFDWISAESVMNDQTVVIFDDYYEGIDTIGSMPIVEYTIPHDKFVVEKLQPVDEFIMPDGRKQLTQMVKVTRRKQAEIQNLGVDEKVYKHDSFLHNEL